MSEIPHPEFSNSEEKASLSLADGETICGGIDATPDKGFNEGYTYEYAPAGTFIIGKNGPELEAWGGDCAIVALYNPKERVGALIHIDVAGAYSDDHQGLIDSTLNAFPLLRDSNAVRLFVDVANESTISQVIEKWAANIMAYLKSKGLEPVLFREGVGKDVYLDTADGKIAVQDDKGNIIFESQQ